MYCYDTFFKDDLTKFINLQFINRKRDMINWKCVYFIEIGYFIKS